MNDWFMYCVKIATIISSGFLIGLFARRAWSEVRRWWQSGQWHPPEQIDYRAFVNGKTCIKSGTPVGICGLHIVVQAGTGRELVDAGAAVDRGEFWRTWKYFGGQVKGWVDEDGDEVDLTA